GHVPVARDADLGDLRRSRRLRLDRHHHDRVGEVGAVVSVAAVAVEGDVDALQALRLLADARPAAAAQHVADGGDGVAVEDEAELPGDPPDVDAGAEKDAGGGEDRRPLGGEPADAGLVLGGATATAQWSGGEREVGSPSGRWLGTRPGASGPGAALGSRQGVAGSPDAGLLRAGNEGRPAKVTASPRRPGPAWGSTPKSDVDVNCRTRMAAVEPLPTSQALRIEAVAQRTGLTKRTIRYYEELGLVSPSGRSGGGYRLFSEADVARLERISALKDSAGLSLGEIAGWLEAETERDGIRERYFAGRDATAKRGMLTESRAVLTGQLALIERKRRALEELLADYRERLQRIDHLDAELAREQEARP